MITNTAEEEWNSLDQCELSSQQPFSPMICCRRIVVTQEKAFQESPGEICDQARETVQPARLWHSEVERLSLMECWYSCVLLETIYISSLHGRLIFAWCCWLVKAVKRCCWPSDSPLAALFLSFPLIFYLYSFFILFFSFCLTKINPFKICLVCIWLFLLALLNYRADRWDWLVCCISVRNAELKNYVDKTCYEKRHPQIEASATSLSVLVEDRSANSFTPECEVNQAGCWNSKLCASDVCAARTVNWPDSNSSSCRSAALLWKCDICFVSCYLMSQLTFSCSP